MFILSFLSNCIANNVYPVQLLSAESVEPDRVVWKTVRKHRVKFRIVVPEIMTERPYPQPIISGIALLNAAQINEDALRGTNQFALESNYGTKLLLFNAPEKLFCYPQLEVAENHVIIDCHTVISIEFGLENILFHSFNSGNYYLGFLIEHFNPDGELFGSWYFAPETKIRLKMFGYETRDMNNYDIDFSLTHNSSEYGKYLVDELDYHQCPLQWPFVKTLDLNVREMLPSYESKRARIIDDEDLTPEIASLECSLCLDKLGDGPKRILETACSKKHIFHEYCLQQWLKVKSSCPICRSKVYYSPLSENAELKPKFNPFDT